MQKIIKIALLIVLVVGNFSSAWAATYYVRTDGNDSTCDGSQNEAAGDGTCAWLTIEHALGQVSGTNTIEVADGTYEEKQLIVPPNTTLTAVTKLSPPNSGVRVVPYTSYGVGTPQVKMDSGTPGTTGNQTISYITFDGSGEVGLNTAAQGILVEDYNGVTITYCYIYGYTGVATTGNSTSSWGVTVQSTQETYRAHTWSYYVEDTTLAKHSTRYPANPIEDFTFTYNKVEKCGYSGGTGALNANAMFAYHLLNGTIENNNFDHSHTASEMLETTPALWENVTFNNNIVTTHSSGLQGGEDTMWGLEVWVLHGCEFKNNLFHRAGMSTTVGVDNEWAYNYFNFTGLLSTSWSIGIEARLIDNAKIHHNRYDGTSNTRTHLFITTGVSNGGNTGLTLDQYVWGNAGYNHDGNGMYWIDNLNTSGTTGITSNAYYTNNTCHTTATGKNCIRIDDGTGVTSEVYLRNNLMIDAGYGIKVDSGSPTFDSDYNLYYNLSTNSDPSSIYTNESNKVTTEPSFVEVPNDMTAAASGNPQVMSSSPPPMMTSLMLICQTTIQWQITEMVLGITT
jgi:hypothetical protein